MQRAYKIFDSFCLSGGTNVMAKLYRYRRPDYVSKSDTNCVRQIYRFKMRDQF